MGQGDHYLTDYVADHSFHYRGRAGDQSSDGFLADSGPISRAQLDGFRQIGFPDTWPAPDGRIAAQESAQCRSGFFSTGDHLNGVDLKSQQPAAF